MNDHLSYPWALIYGLYFYVLFQAVFFVRFGTINTAMSTLDLSIIAVGILSVLLLMFFMRKLGREGKFMLIPFVVAIPFAYVGALGGGLLGHIGILVYGAVPFIAILSIGYIGIRLLRKDTNV